MKRIKRVFVANRGEIALRIVSATSRASASEETFWPGSTGTPARTASSRARSLSPLSSITSAGGPTKVIPLSCARAASFGLSERNP